MPSRLLAKLNPDQQQVVLATHGPVLVLAGAGSGKTRALTYRVAYLLEQGLARPSEILAVTFTNKAAREMKERIATLVGSTVTPSAVGTFHGLCARLLREQAGHTQRSASFTIVDTADTQHLIKQALEAQGVSPREWSPTSVRHQISRAKNSLLSPADLAAAATSAADELIARTYLQYQHLLARNDAFDFDDLILETIRLLAQAPAIRQHYQQRWPFISVDEYQDTNAPQEKFLQLLLGPAKNLCVVGDDYQAIYSWRGAQVDHILRFSSRFPECTTIYLTQNYRSTPAIIQAANHVIAENQTQLHKQLWTARAASNPVRVVALPSDRHEATWVRQQLETHVADGGSPADVVILYRTNAQSRLFEEEFLLHQMPYTIVGGFRFYDRLEVKDAVAFLQLWANPHATVALTRLARSLWKGIGPKTLARWDALAQTQHVSLLAAARQPGGLTVRQQASVAPVMQAFEQAQSQSFATVAELLLSLLNTSGYTTYLKRQPDGEERWNNIEELLNVAALSTEVSPFLENVALMSDIDDLPEVTERVTCMTLHAAKGLEFSRVFIVGCEEGLLPHINSLDTAAQLEEERRLLYVGMTRAQEGLTLTYASSRSLRGETLPQLPSRFLRALPQSCERYEELAATTSVNDLSSLLNNFSSPANTHTEPVTVSAEVGEFITHPIFGRGVVIQAAGSLLTCVFETYGVKTIDSGALLSSVNL